MADSMTVALILDSIKRMQWYEIIVDLPDDFSLRGKMPFDVSVSGAQAKFRILAINEDIATEKVYAFLNKLDDQSQTDTQG